MAKALSEDIRARIFGHVNEGHSRRAAAEKFAVAASTAVRIMARHAASGTVAPKPQRHGRRSKLDTQRDYLARRIIEVPDITLLELAGELTKLGIRIDPSNLSRWFIRNGYSLKKACPREGGERCWPANKIDLMSNRRAMSGADGSLSCAGMRANWFSLMKPVPTRRWCGFADAV